MDAVAPRVRARDWLAAHLTPLKLDRALADGASPDGSGALALRARNLVGRSLRRQLGRTIDRIVAEPAYGKAPGACVAVARNAVLEAHDDLEALARRLRRTDPVDARGVARARLLLSDGRGPLFWQRRGGELKAQVQQAIDALDLDGADRAAQGDGEEATP